ncbi:MAG: hypothetical protein HY231_11815 [Acidobacteria bacterium]|nr:hypothetical protein [Acidobacteriota bacterium]
MRSTLWIELYLQRSARLIDQLLRRPDGASAGLREAGGVPIADALLVALPLAALYGIGMGLGAGLRTAMYNGAKLSLVLFASAAICLPSFYVFASLAGSRFSLREAARAIAGFALITAVIWAALAPVTGFFTASVAKGSFLIVLHISAIVLGFAIGGSILGRALIGSQQKIQVDEDGAARTPPAIEKTPVNQPTRFRVSPTFYLIWFVVYAVVVSQLFVDFTPYLEASPFFRPERTLFFEAARQALN